MSGIQGTQSSSFSTINSYLPNSGPVDSSQGSSVGGGLTSGTPGQVGGPQAGTSHSNIYTQPKSHSFSDTVLDGVKDVLDALFGKNTAPEDKQKIVDAIKDLWAKPLEVGDKLARLIVETAGNKSRQQMDDAVSESDRAASELMMQAATMREAATMMIVGAAIQLGMTVASSAIQIGGSMMKTSDLAAAKGLKEDKDIAIGQANALGDKMNAISQLVGAIGSFVSQVMQAEAKNLDADGAEWAARAQRTNAQHDISQKLADDLQKLADQIVQLLNEIRQTEVSMMQSMTRV